MLSNLRSAFWASAAWGTGTWPATASGSGGQFGERIAYHVDNGLCGCLDFCCLATFDYKIRCLAAALALYFTWKLFQLTHLRVACYFATNFKYQGRAACNLPAASPYCRSGSYGI
jgi:hypothetical protein